MIAHSSQLHNRPLHFERDSAVYMKLLIIVWLVVVGFDSSATQLHNRALHFELNILVYMVMASLLMVWLVVIGFDTSFCPAT